MRIPCPHCGARDAQEFAYRGDAAPSRPDLDSGQAAFADYVYLRDNPAGHIQEYWHHTQGCRAWLIVTRDTRTHAIFSARFAGERGE
ncbi:MAG: sarcosine oxidase subunit delta [Caulobacterales bacterium]